MSSRYTHGVPSTSNDKALALPPNMSDIEKRAFCAFLNGELRGDPELKATLPINLNSDDFYKELSNGLLLRWNQTTSSIYTYEYLYFFVHFSKFIAKRFPNVPVGPSNESVIAAAKELDITINIEPEELNDTSNNVELVLEFVWQLIKVRGKMINLFFLWCCGTYSLSNSGIYVRLNQMKTLNVC